MKGMELARDYFMQYRRPMLEERFEAYMSRITIGLCGEGSECFGFDDEISRDHDFGPAFCLWTTWRAAMGISLQRRQSSG